MNNNKKYRNISICLVFSLLSISSIIGQDQLASFYSTADVGYHKFQTLQRVYHETPDRNILSGAAIKTPFAPTIGIGLGGSVAINRFLHLYLDCDYKYMNRFVSKSLKIPWTDLVEERVRLATHSYYLELGINIKFTDFPIFAGASIGSQEFFFRNFYSKSGKIEFKQSTLVEYYKYNESYNFHLGYQFNDHIRFKIEYMRYIFPYFVFEEYYAFFSEYNDLYNIEFGVQYLLAEKQRKRIRYRK